MQWLNYNHLYYFWMVAKEGGVTAASRELRLSPSTVSAQLASLEDMAGHALFKRQGRKLVLTDMGQRAFRVANDIFALGTSLQSMFEGGEGPSSRLVVGAAMVVPKLVVHRLLPVATLLERGIVLVCVEDRPHQLMAQLGTGEVDLMISDAPAPTRSRISSYNHHLGDCGISLFASPELIEKHGKDLPKSLDGAPFLMPTEHSTLRRQLEHYFKRHEIHPRVVGEFQDSALMKVYGEHSWGIFPSPTPIAEEVCRQYRVEHIGELPIKERFYAITTERRITDAAVADIVAKGRAWFESV